MFCTYVPAYLYLPTYLPAHKPTFLSTWLMVYLPTYLICLYTYLPCHLKCDKMHGLPSKPSISIVINLICFSLIILAFETHRAQVHEMRQQQEKEVQDL